MSGNMATVLHDIGRDTGSSYPDPQIPRREYALSGDSKPISNDLSLPTRSLLPILSNQVLPEDYFQFPEPC